MKFCYLDESGTGSEPYAVMVGVIVDGSRMQVTKDDWRALLRALSKIVGKPVKEFHTKDFYSGNSYWRELSGDKRSQIISEILEWLKTRKHKVSFSAVEKKKYFANCKEHDKLKEIGSLWCMLGLHQILSLQKAHQSQGAKGYTVFIFDEKLEERERIVDLVSSMPEWTDTYYSKKKKHERLHKVVDVPYFGNSEKVHLLQIADLLAYILRRHAEIQDAKLPVKYTDEEEKVKIWVQQISRLALPSSSRYLKNARCECAGLFFEYAPPSLKSI